MCGIAGIIGRRSTANGKTMALKLKHRGPDNSSVWVTEESAFPATLVHTRLSVIDLSQAGDMPMHSQCGRYTLVYNGEIYNYIELRNELSRLGCNFKSNSDSEVLLQGLMLHGLEFQSRCNGMWAFCLYDSLLGCAYFGRDRFGVKPLFYHICGDGSLLFASEMKAITPLLNSVSPSPDVDFCFRNLFGYEATSIAVIDGISRLPAGCQATFSNKRLSVSRWWETIEHVKPLQSNNYLEHVRTWQTLFSDSVALRLRSDVPLAISLSGGLDSSTIASYISKSIDLEATSYPHQILSVCATYPGSSIDESHWARMVSDSTSFKHISKSVDPLASGWTIEEALAQVEDPYLTIPLPMLSTYKAIKEEGISVSIDGHGADELLSGYGQIPRALLSSSNSAEMNEVLSIYDSTKTGVYSTRERRSQLTLSRRYAKEVLTKIGLRCLDLKREHINRSRIQAEINQRLMSIRSHPNYKRLDPFTAALFEIFEVTILPTLLRNYDRYSMACGVETRAPFLDWRLVTFTHSLPWASKLGGTYSKRILRDASLGILIDPVRLRRDKIGWNAPMHEWLNNELSDYIVNLIHSSKHIRYATKLRRQWKRFKHTSSPSYLDGQRLWQSALPLCWSNSLESDLWH